MPDTDYQYGEAAALAQCGLLLDFTKTARATKTEREAYQRKLDRRFKRLKKLLRRRGKKVETGHKRILIPKRILSRRDLNRLGFVPVTAAIPEAGQTRFRSFRHPKNKYHVHEHGRDWTMHKDRHTASTMMGYGDKGQGLVSGAWNSVANAIKGLPHLVTEGLPGIAYYTGGRLTGSPTMKERLKKDMSPEYFDRLKTWKRYGRVSKPKKTPKIEPTPMPQTPLPAPPLAKAAQIGHLTALKQLGF